MAYEFDNTGDRIVVAGVSVPTVGSLAFWIKPTWAQADGVDHMIFEIGNAPTRNQLFHFEHYIDNALYVGWYNALGAGDVRFGVASSAYTLVQNQWNLFQYLWSTTAGLHALYLNGAIIKAATLASNASFTTTGQDFVIGNYPSGSGTADARGRMADFEMWSRLLTVEELAQQKQRKSIANTTGRVFKLPMDTNLTEAWNGLTVTNTSTTNQADMPTQTGVGQSVFGGGVVRAA